MALTREERLSVIFGKHPTAVKKLMWHEHWNKLEALVGLLATFFIGFAPPVLLLLFGLASLINNPRYLPGWLSLVGVLATGAPAWWTARMASRALYSCYPELKKLDRISLGSEQGAWTPLDSEEPDERIDLPLAVVMGVRLPRLPLVFALPLSVWWLAHFGTGVLIGLGADHSVESSIHRPSPLTKFLLSQMMSFAFTFATNLYLLLSIAAFVRRPHILSRLWSWRFVIDLGLMLVTGIPAALKWLK